MSNNSQTADKEKTEKDKVKLDETSPTQASQASVPNMNEKVPEVEIKSSTNTLGPVSKRKRPREVGSVSASQDSGSVRFQKTCRKCHEIRSSLNHEMAKLKKLNSEQSRDAKKLEKEIEVLRKDKEMLQNSVNFLQSLCKTLDADKMELKQSNTKLSVKVNNLKKILLN